MSLIRFLYHNKKFILLCVFIHIIFWLTIGTFRQSTDNKNIPEPTQSKSIFSFILDDLYKLKLNLLLIDPYALDYLFIRQLPFEKFDKKLITFGLIDLSFKTFTEYFQNKNFLIKISKNISIDHIFIEYEEKIIHLAILHPYHSFYLVKKNTLSLSNDIQLSYGDTIRAIEHVENALYEYLFYYPQNVSHFLWLYKTSEFLYCNRLLANKMEHEYHLYQNASQLDLIVKPMRTIAEGLNKLEKHHWLVGGTLIGWYRHCGFVPFTQDVDFCLFAEEYDESIRNYFLGNPVCYLWGALGLVNDSLEFRLFTGRFTLDLFWAYRENDRRWCGYQVHRSKFRRIVPLLPKLCSCELYGYRFNVPCSPVDYLNDEYGIDKWKIPLEKNFTWINMKFHSTWDDISWMYATRLYTREGKLRTDKFAIDWISNHFNYSLKSIPSFLNVLPTETVTLPPLKPGLRYGSSVKKNRTKEKKN